MMRLWKNIANRIEMKMVRFRTLRLLAADRCTVESGAHGQKKKSWRDDILQEVNWLALICGESFDQDAKVWGIEEKRMKIFNCSV